MRLSSAEILQITGKKQRPAQLRWFKNHLGVTPPCDSEGPILTKESFDALVAKRLGLNPAVKPGPEVKTKGAS